MLGYEQHRVQRVVSYIFWTGKRMRIHLSLHLFLSASEHNYNVALGLYGPPAMARSGIIPVLPLNAVTETNRETLVWLKHDLVWISEDALSAGDAYHMLRMTSRVGRSGVTWWSRHAWTIQERYLC